MEHELRINLQSSNRNEEPLALPDERFDLVLCQQGLQFFSDRAAALAEMRRVLKPGGRYLFIEHGRSSRPSTARWQDRLNPIWRRLMDG